MNDINQKVREFDIPVRMRGRPVASNGFPIPWFVEFKGEDGEWDFRVTRPERYVEAHNKQLCWVCGQPLGRFRTFVIGPMCAVNRITSEPPTHRECAEWSVRVCPFLSQPRMRRNQAALPEGAGDGTPGVMLKRNPGVIMLWHSERGGYRVMKMKDKDKGFLFQLQDNPLNTEWFRAGQPAKRDEVMESVESGLPSLWEMTKKDGVAAEQLLEKMIVKAHTLLFDRIAV